MYVHRLAFDPELSRCSPGLVNTLDALEAAADEGMTRVEFLGGGERYKIELADRTEPLFHGFGMASGVRGRAYAAAQLAHDPHPAAPEAVAAAAQAVLRGPRAGAARYRSSARRTRWAVNRLPETKRAIGPN